MFALLRDTPDNDRASANGSVEGDYYALKNRHDDSLQSLSRKHLLTASLNIIPIGNSIEEIAFTCRFLKLISWTQTSCSSRQE